MTQTPARKTAAQRIRQSLGRHMPGREAITGHRLLRPVARHMQSPGLWHLQHESVARGAAIGIFWAFALPVGQVIAAAAHCVWWRANIPVAAGFTFLTNPFTLGFWLWLAYETGTLVVDAPPLVMPGQGVGLREWLQDVGGPVALGMGVFAMGGAAVGYVMVKLGWRLRVIWKRRNRQGRNSGQ